MHAATLVLNATREPLCVVPLARAVTLVLTGKATAVVSGAALRSARTTMQVPQVVVLTRYVHTPYRASIPFSRRAVLARDGYRCAYCRLRATTVDHVIPRSRGGSDSFENCVAACSRCNSMKADRTLADLGWTLPAAPRAPRRESAITWTHTASNPLWLPYLGYACTSAAP